MHNRITLFFSIPPRQLPSPALAKDAGPWLLELDDAIPSDAIYQARISSPATLQIIALWKMGIKDEMVLPPDCSNLAATPLVSLVAEHLRRARRVDFLYTERIVQRLNELFLPPGLNLDGTMTYGEVGLMSGNTWCSGITVEISKPRVWKPKPSSEVASKSFRFCGASQQQSQELRTSRHRIWELSDILGHVVEFSGDQLGSRHIETKLEAVSAEEKAQGFEEILSNMLQLPTDVFAN
ncbi:hypothetical protein BCR35DRAFT_335240 [Leucosporidium creatinivorum]|uniref:PUM-HD domain-containing protein n=1 Tax=Leucosporidium creatinivorum TaxID=106004 RepID=A0A1Y2DFD9_9BASI|nr:hypothetical protein BCR35DRAFT_335240 [Leucosporidium creatinivorum]